MRLQDFYPIIVTEHLSSCRDFYRDWFGMAVDFDSSWFVLLSDEAGGKASVAFMHPSHPSAPPGPEPFNGKGMCLEFQVEEARAAKFNKEFKLITCTTSLQCAVQQY